MLTDPMKKEVAAVRKRIDLVNRELKSLGQACQKKVPYTSCRHIIHIVLSACIILCLLTSMKFSTGEGIQGNFGDFPRKKQRKNPANNHINGGEYSL